MAEKIGEFAELVLLAILKLGNDTYGVPIIEALEEATGKTVSVGAIYTTLERMEQKGFVSSRMGDRTNERGGRAKKYFRVEASGQAALREAERVRKSLAAGLDPAVVKG